MSIKFSEFKIKDEGFKEAKRNIKKGDDFFEFNQKGTYLKSLSFYLKAYDYNPDNAELNYKIGV